MADIDDIDPNELDPNTIRFNGHELGVVTDLPGGVCRLVLKPVHQRYSTLTKLVDKHGGTVIDIERTASEVEEEIIRLVGREQETTGGEIPEPSGGQRYEVAGNTYPIRKALKQIGFRWDAEEEIWYTWDPEKWDQVFGPVIAIQQTNRRIKIPKCITPSLIPSSTPEGRYRISTDGACISNPGPGGWAAVIVHDGEVRRIMGRVDDTTNNRMELWAIGEALSEIPSDSEVEIRSDSRYAIKIASGEWNASENRALVEAVRRQVDRHEVEWTKVEGHSGDPENEEADDLAEAAVRGFPEGRSYCPDAI
ncbi:ribonuclease H family protein [Salinibacter ruber]|jgi:ribonuclease HI|uniref:ribonuclease H n=1 Tax=Salinibacter ruber (strain DSM 13855 / M31) TaxID=309807 RepID=Q2S3J4_SALRD|nr:ribonuclease H [Salinibacter ruber]ABC44521.1 ribonuclease H [Salinibacter ruber DSM 13855]MCS4101513.1 ribonuclease HI [Salinibacter ruber]